MIAALPMYDLPSSRAAHDAFWALIRDGLRARGVEAPDALDRETAYDAGWGRADLVLGQICNLPLRARFADKVTVIGTADYGLDGCPAGHYASVIVVRADAPKVTVTEALQQRFACNDTLSQSGFASAWMLAQSLGFDLEPTLITGAHTASMRAVVAGDVDCAALDAHTWRMAQLDDPMAARLRVIGITRPSPGMTFITRRGQDPAPYFKAIASAISSLNDADKATLGLRAIVRLPASDYDLPIPPLSKATA